MAPRIINLSNTTPAAPAGSMNVSWLGDVSTPEDVSGSLPKFTGDTGSGGVMGLVPAPGAGDAAAGKFLSAAGGFAVPPYPTPTIPAPVIPTTSGVPSDSPMTGTVRFDPSTNFLYIYNGTAWKKLLFS